MRFHSSSALIPGECVSLHRRKDEPRMFFAVSFESCAYYMILRDAKSRKYMKAGDEAKKLI